MTKAVLDSSVLYSAFLKPGSIPAALLLRAREGAFLLYLSLYIVEETVAVLSREKARAQGATPERVARFRRDLMAVAHLVTELPDIRAVPADSKDNPIVATAVAAGADYLVTGDRKHLLPLGEYQGIRIVTPRQFLDLLS